MSLKDRIASAEFAPWPVLSNTQHVYDGRPCSNCDRGAFVRVAEQDLCARCAFGVGVAERVAAVVDRGNRG